ADRKDAEMNFAFPDKVKNSIETQKRRISVYADRRGLSPEWAENAIKSAIDQTYTGVIQRMLTTEPDSTQASIRHWERTRSILEEVKSELSPNAYQNLSRAIDQKSIHSESILAWDQVSHLRLENGSPDLDKMQNAIYSMKGSPEKKERYWDYVK